MLNGKTRNFMLLKKSIIFVLFTLLCGMPGTSSGNLLGDMLSKDKGTKARKKKSQPLKKKEEPAVDKKKEGGTSEEGDNEEGRSIVS
ncbi:MAG: hypothetical protein H6925_05590 [Holosporaceae bacterium]|nr:MAG: hypothetical protein H6925_05590 [Holosporaceae bacterium]